MKEIPIGVALIVCDRVIADAMTQEKTLVGTFSNLRAASFPCMHPRMTVFVSVQNGRGQIESEIKCINESDNSVIFGMKGMIPFNNPNDVVEMAFQFHNLMFPKPGLHSIQLFCEGQLILQRRFNLSIVNPSQPK